MNTRLWRKDKLYLSIRKMIDIQCSEVSTNRLKALKTNRTFPKSKFSNKLTITRKFYLPEKIEKKSMSLEKINTERQKLLPIKTLEIAESARNIFTSNSDHQIRQKQKKKKLLFNIEFKKTPRINMKHDSSRHSQL